MSVTIWNTLADDGAGAIATRRAIVAWTEPEGDAAPEPIWGEPVALVRLTEAKWTRPRWNAAMRADPASNGAGNFEPGERILDDVIAPWTATGAEKAKGALGSVPVVDLEAGTATWSHGEVDRPLAVRKAEMLAAVDAAFKARRAGGTSITVGQATIPVATIHEAVVELIRAKVVMGQGGSMGVVNRAKIPVTLTPAGADTMLEAIDAHVAGCQQTEHDLYVAIAAAADHDALDLIDVAAGTVDGGGGWPSGA